MPISRLQQDMEKLVQAQITMTANDYQGAKKLLLEVVVNTPATYEKITEVDNRLYFEYWDEDEFEAFLEYHGTHRKCQQVTGTQSVYPKALFTLAYIEVEDGNLGNANIFLKKLLELEPDQPRCYTEIAAILSGQEKHAEALMFYWKAMTIRSYLSSNNKAIILRGMAVQSIELGELAEAESYLRESLTFDPDSKLAHNELEYIASLKAGVPKEKISLWLDDQSFSLQIPICCRCGKRLVISNDRYSIVQSDNTNRFVCASCDES